MAREYQQGKYKLIHREKYRGDADNIVYRSSWERRLLQWLDHNPDVIEFSSEELVIPYRCSTDGKIHRYFVDFVVKFKTGKTIMIEVKPKSQTRVPVRTQGKSRESFLIECLTYMKNNSKWESAKEYAEKNDAVFQVWTEQTLEALGINLNIGKYPVRKK